MKDEVSLLVLSCDLYEDAWYPYFELIRKNWPEHPQIYLVTEEKNYSHRDLNIITVKTGKDIWTNRVKRALSQINSEFVLFSLEDYFLHEPVDDSAFIDALNKMKLNSKWGGVGFIQL